MPLQNNNAYIFTSLSIQPLVVSNYAEQKNNRISMLVERLA